MNKNESHRCQIQEAFLQRCLHTRVKFVHEALPLLLFLCQMFTGVSPSLAATEQDY